MSLLKVLGTPIVRPMTRFNLCLPKQHSNSPFSRLSSLSQNKHLTSLRLISNSILLNSSRCLSVHVHCVNQKSSTRKLLHVKYDSNLSIHLNRYVATEPSTGYEYVLASQPVHLAQTIFEQCHELTGLPWWGTIVATTLGLRLAMTLPFAVYSKHNAAKVEKLQPELLGLAKQTFVRRYRHRATAEKWSQDQLKKMIMYLSKNHARELYIRDNCHPAKSFVIIMVQLPLWVCLSLALRNMTGFQLGGKLFIDPDFLISDFAAGGTLWFSNLSLPDQYYIFPILFGALNLFNIEMQALQKGPVVKGQKYLFIFMRMVSVAMIPIATFVPVALSMYWATSASYSTCQNILLKLPSTRALLRMPSTKVDSQTPFRDMQDAFKQKYLRKANRVHHDKSD